MCALFCCAVTSGEIRFIHHIPLIPFWRFLQDVTSQNIGKDVFGVKVQMMNTSWFLSTAGNAMWDLEKVTDTENPHKILTASQIFGCQTLIEHWNSLSIKELAFDETFIDTYVGNRTWSRLQWKPCIDPLSADSSNFKTCVARFLPPRKFRVCVCVVSLKNVFIFGSPLGILYPVRGCRHYSIGSLIWRNSHSLI